MLGHELALERLLRERDKLQAEERSPEMLLLIESLQAAEKAATELAEAAAIAREHPLPSRSTLGPFSAEEWLHGMRCSWVLARHDRGAATGCLHLPSIRHAPFPTRR